MFQVMCDWSMTSVPLSSSRTRVAFAMSVKRLSHRHQRGGALLLELLDALWRVIEEAAPSLDPEPPFLLELGCGARDARLVREVAIQVAGDARVDVEAGHVQ